MHADLTSFRLFVAVAEAGSISAGAARLDLALAAASKRIAQTEARAGVALLERHARGVTLSAAGHAYLGHARSVLLALDRLDAELGEYRVGVKGHVHVTANASAIALRLPGDLGRFLQSHPELRIDLEERSSAEVVRCVAQGVAEIGIFEAETPAPQLECFDYCQDQLALIAATGHPLLRRKRVAAAEVFAHEMVGLHDGTSLSRTIGRAAQDAGLALRVRMRVRSFDAMCRMVEQGIGVGVLPRAAIEPQLKSLRIRSVVLDAAWAARRHVVGVRSLRSLPLAAQALLRHLGQG